MEPAMSPLPIPRRGAGWSARVATRASVAAAAPRPGGARHARPAARSHAPGSRAAPAASSPHPTLPLRPDLLLRRGGRVLGRPGAHLLLQRRRELLAGKGGDDRLVHERLDRPSGDPGPLTPVRLLRGPARATRHAPTAALVPTAQQPAVGVGVRAADPLAGAAGEQPAQPLEVAPRDDRLPGRLADDLAAM